MISTYRFHMQIFSARNDNHESRSYPDTLVLDPWMIYSIEIFTILLHDISHTRQGCFSPPIHKGLQMLKTHLATMDNNYTPIVWGSVHCWCTPPRTTNSRSLVHWEYYQWIPQLYLKENLPTFSCRNSKWTPSTMKQRPVVVCRHDDPTPAVEVEPHRIMESKTLQ